MARRVKVDVKIGALRSIKELNKPENQRAIGDAIVKGMKDLISSGQSPVKGFPRFVEYSGARKRKTRKTARGRKSTAKSLGYPFNVQDEYPDKKVRPVNLKLSGDMLAELKADPITRGVRIGIIDAEQAVKAKLHNDGGPQEIRVKRRVKGGKTKSVKLKYNMPQRKFIPDNPGERFKITIERIYLSLYSEILDRILKK